MWPASKIVTALSFSRSLLARFPSWGFGNGTIPFHLANKPEMSESLHSALNQDEGQRKAKYEDLRDFINANTSAKLVKTFIEKPSARCKRPEDPC
ncbi:hypothetical protein N7535_009102 [Penicillium sp. DV-2018c]|nr:hypothetical protein N7535_009102 [Penicillium sp. DV-2018c]